MAEDFIDMHVESLVRTLALKDVETEEHTRRVTELALKFAVLCGVASNDLKNIRRGALLHDIGKIGVPDNILNKKEELTDEDLRLIRLHPVHAYNLLHPVSYLHSALDIPYCHHEKWDGTGYPQGIKGTTIPFSCRLFAIVDVWDALLSDRPYRPALTVEKAMEYLQGQSGKHFEPRLVDVFLNTLALIFSTHTLEIF